jgi:NADPH:quinone reductase-like Zn-dependent oxidoreductase
MHGRRPGLSHCGRNVEFVKGLGADRVIDYSKEDFTEGSGRYDLVFDAVSMSSFGACKRVLTPAGIYVNTLPNATIVVQLITMLLPGKKARSMWVKPNAADIAWMMEQIKRGMVRIVIDRSYPLDRIKDALTASEAGRTRGKIVVSVG